MFEQTIERLRSGDRRGAKSALKQELAEKKQRDQEAELDTELDRIRDDDLARRAQEAEAEQSAKAERARQSRLSRARRQLIEAAAEFDSALEVAEAKFHEIEACLAAISENGGRRVHVTASKWMIVAACWSGARHLSARLGLARSPGGPSKHRTMVSAVTQIAGEQK